MKKYNLLLLSLLIGSYVFGQNQESIKLTIQLRGVYESKISLMPMIKGRAQEATIFKEGVKNGQTITLDIPKKDLPLEYVVRYDYKTNIFDQPYPSEQFIIFNNQDIFWSVNPPYCNNEDSLKFHPSEIENNLMRRFQKESSKKLKGIQVIQQFLFSYDDINSNLFKEALKEFNLRKDSFNNWLKEQKSNNKTTYASSTFSFNYIPTTIFSGNERENLGNLVEHYLEGFDFNDEFIIRTSNIHKFMDNYLTMYGKLLTKNSEVDSLYSKIAENTIEKAKKGNPFVYGWFVDYFYEGFEQNGLKEPMKVLAKYIDDPNCKTKRRKEVEKRISGIEKIQIGTLAPNIDLTINGKTTKLHSLSTKAKYKLLLFWSADCEHCVEFVNAFYPYYETIKTKNIIEVIAYSLDDTEPEVKKWNEMKPKFNGWQHLRGDRGINSKSAAEYFILSTPTMFIIDSKTNKIAALPNNMDELKKFLK